jgi:hypothetical protein
MYEQCEHCDQHIEPAEQIVQILSTVPVTTEQQDIVEVEGPTAIYIAAHAPPLRPGDRVTYEGPLRGLRPAAK